MRTVDLAAMVTVGMMRVEVDPAVPAVHGGVMPVDGARAAQIDLTADVMTVAMTVETEDDRHGEAPNETVNSVAGLGSRPRRPGVRSLASPTGSPATSWTVRCINNCAP